MLKFLKDNDIVNTQDEMAYPEYTDLQQIIRKENNELRGSLFETSIDPGHVLSVLKYASSPLILTKRLAV